MRKILEELIEKEFSINFSNTKESIDKIRLFFDFYKDYKNSIKENAEKIGRDLKKLSELDKKTNISLVEETKNNLEKEISVFYRKLKNEFKCSYSYLKYFARTKNIDRLKEKRKETDLIAESYKLFSDFIPRIKEIEKYNKNCSKREELLKQFYELQKLYKETRGNIKYLKNIYRKNFWFISPHNIIRKMKRNEFFEGQILSENLKYEIKRFIKNKIYEKNFMQEPQCKINSVPEKYFRLNNILNCKTEETNWNDRFKKAMEIFSPPESDQEINYLRNLFCSLRKNLESGYLSRLYKIDAQNPATIFLKNINYNN